MKIKKQYIYIIAVSIVAVLAVSLFSKGYKNSEQPTATEESKPVIKPLNITVMLDLSNRIIRNDGNQANIPQAEKDSTILMNIQKGFYKRQYKNGMMNFTQDKIQVICYPNPSLSNINNIISDMAVDLTISGGPSIANNKRMLRAMEGTWSSSISSIYRQTIASSNWVGSDIWGFFAKDAEMLCVKQDHRNILIILTDGYIQYTKNWEQTSPNVYTGILPRTVKNQTAITPTGKNYNDKLEVLFLEINPLSARTSDFNKIEQLITSWCNGMGIKKMQVVQTNLPTHTQKYIDSFIGW